MMIEREFMEYVWNGLNQHNDLYELYETLAYLTDRNPRLALKTGFFEFLVFVFN